MSGFAGLTGSYTLHPGHALSITGRRPVLGQGLLSRLLRGQRGEQVERTLGALFTLCAHAHQRAARLALNAARLPDQPPRPEPPTLLLSLETARDHLRSMALDWPRQLAQFNLATRGSCLSNQPPAQEDPALPATNTAAKDWLNACPLPLAQPAQALTEAQTQESFLALRSWLHKRVLLQPLEDWLAQHRTPQALAHWCQRLAADLPPAHFLATCHAQASALSPQGPALALLDLGPAKQTAQLTDLATHIATQTGFAQFPTCNGQCQETGPWTRLRHRPSPAVAQTTASTNAWTRLSSRWLELIELVLLATQGTGNSALASGALNLGQGQAIAWCEMARGLLLHWVQLDSAGQVADYRVIAPTEWNFHPDGALANALRVLAPDDTASAWVLAAAYDACVECTVAIKPE